MSDHISLSGSLAKWQRPEWPSGTNEVTERLPYGPYLLRTELHERNLPLGASDRIAAWSLCDLCESSYCIWVLYMGTVWDSTVFTLNGNSSPQSIPKLTPYAGKCIWIIYKTKAFLAGPALENFGHPLCISKMLSKKSYQTFGAEGVWRAFFMSPAATSGDQLGIISCIARSQLFQGETLQNYHQVLIPCSSVSLTMMYKKSVYISTWKMFHQSGSFHNACTR